MHFLSPLFLIFFGSLLGRGLAPKSNKLPERKKSFLLHSSFCKVFSSPFPSASLSTDVVSAFRFCLKRMHYNLLTTFLLLPFFIYIKKK